MHFTLDCEFNGYRGHLLSMALFNNAHSIYIVIDHEDRDPPLVPWVAEHVAPFLNQGIDFRLPSLESLALHHQHCLQVARMDELPGALDQFFKDACPQQEPVIHSDWPDDLRYFSEAVITGPGMMIDLPGYTGRVHRVDAYPTSNPDAVQHHAWWDAFVLHEHLKNLGKL